jgi:hypothetical protein
VNLWVKTKSYNIIHIATHSYSCIKEVRYINIYIEKYIIDIDIGLLTEMVAGDSIA